MLKKAPLRGPEEIILGPSEEEDTTLLQALLQSDDQDDDNNNAIMMMNLPMLEHDSDQNSDQVGVDFYDDLHPEVPLQHNPCSNEYNLEVSTSPSFIESLFLDEVFNDSSTNTNITNITLNVNNKHIDTTIYNEYVLQQQQQPPPPPPPPQSQPDIDEKHLQVFEQELQKPKIKSRRPKMKVEKKDARYMRYRRENNKAAAANRALKRQERMAAKKRYESAKMLNSALKQKVANLEKQLAVFAEKKLFSNSNHKLWVPPALPI